MIERGFVMNNRYHGSMKAGYMIEKFINGLVEDWNQAWKWLSVQAAILFGIIVSFASTNPEEFAQIMEMLPDWARPLMGVLVALIPIYLRLKKQGGQDGQEK